MLCFIRRFKATDVTSSVMKGAASFCTVYAISRGKISSVRSATSSPPPLCMLRPKLPARPSNASNDKNSIPRAMIRQREAERTQDEIEIKYKYVP